MDNPGTTGEGAGVLGRTAHQASLSDLAEPLWLRIVLLPWTLLTRVFRHWLILLGCVVLGSVASLHELAERPTVHKARASLSIPVESVPTEVLLQFLQSESVLRHLVQRIGPRSVLWAAEEPPAGKKVEASWLDRVVGWLRPSEGPSGARPRRGSDAHDASEESLAQRAVRDFRARSRVELEKGSHVVRLEVYGLDAAVAHTEMKLWIDALQDRLSSVFPQCSQPRHRALEHSLAIVQDRERALLQFLEENPELTDSRESFLERRIAAFEDVIIQQEVAGDTVAAGVDLEGIQARLDELYRELEGVRAGLRKRAALEAELDEAKARVRELEVMLPAVIIDPFERVREIRVIDPPIVSVVPPPSSAEALLAGAFGGFVVAAVLALVLDFLAWRFRRWRLRRRLRKEALRAPAS